MHSSHERVPVNDTPRRQVPSDFNQPPPLRRQASHVSAPAGLPASEPALAPGKASLTAAGRLGAVGLALLVAGVLCGLVPHSKHVEAVSLSKPNVPGQLPAYSSPATDYYCGSPWVPNYGGCTVSDFGAFPQVAVLLVALGLIAIGAYLALRPGTRSQAEG